MKRSMGKITTKTVMLNSQQGHFQTSKAKQLNSSKKYKNCSRKEKCSAQEASFLPYNAPLLKSTIHSTARLLAYVVNTNRTASSADRHAQPHPDMSFHLLLKTGQLQTKAYLRKENLKEYAKYLLPVIHKFQNLRKN